MMPYAINDGGEDFSRVVVVKHYSSRRLKTCSPMILKVPQ